MTQENKHYTSATPEETLFSQLGDYLCVDPELGEFVFDYFNDLLTIEQRLEFEDHLSLCLACEEVLGQLVCLSEHSATAEKESVNLHTAHAQHRDTKSAGC